LRVIKKKSEAELGDRTYLRYGQLGTALKEVLPTLLLSKRCFLPKRYFLPQRGASYTPTPLLSGEGKTTLNSEPQILDLGVCTLKSKLYPLNPEL